VRVVKTTITTLLQKDFVRFCIVGGVGFIVNALLLKLFVDYGHLRVYIAQAVAAEIALFLNFLFHHNWTYKHKTENKTIKQLIIQFHLASWAAIFGSALVVAVLVNKFKLSLILSLAISSVIALFWNFFWSKYIIWRNNDTNGSGE
jgi:putative flippase GtrA